MSRTKYPFFIKRTQFDYELHRNQDVTVRAHQIPLFEELVGHVTHNGLNLLLKQVALEASASRAHQEGSGEVEEVRPCTGV